VATIVGEFAAPAAYAQTTATYGPGPGGSIPDNNATGISSTITVNTLNQVVTSLNSVTITGLTHPWMGDLTATLSKDGVSVNLFARPGGANDNSNFNGTYTFNATAAQTVAQATAALGNVDLAPGTYRADGNLASFANLNLGGNWTLNINDQGAADVGTFIGWQFSATTVTGYSNNTGGTIPDNSSSGVTSDIVVSDLFQINTFDSVRIRGLQHTLVGDLTARVTNVSTGTTVDLFARPGRTTSDEFDYGYESNLNGDYTFTLGGASFSDAAAQGNTAFDIPTGTYAASTSMVPGEANPNTFNSFNGNNVNGTWRLTLIDSSAGDIGSFTGWGFNVTPFVAVVPEPNAGVFCLLGFAATSLPLYRRARRIAHA
jgi:subtilisin-like proprotein convertase family protein